MHFFVESCRDSLAIAGICRTITFKNKKHVNKSTKSGSLKSPICGDRSRSGQNDRSFWLRRSVGECPDQTNRSIVAHHSSDWRLKSKRSKVMPSEVSERPNDFQPCDPQIPRQKYLDWLSYSSPYLQFELRI